MHIACVSAAVCSHLAGLQQRHARAEEAPLNLSASVARALETHASIHAADMAVRQAEARLKEAKFSPFLQFEALGAVSVAPEVRGTAIFSPDGQLPLSNPWGPLASASLQGTIPLYTFGKIRAAWDAADAGVVESKARVRQAVQLLRFNVRRAFFAHQFAADSQYLLKEAHGRLKQAQGKLAESAEEGEEDSQALYKLAFAALELEARQAQADRAATSARIALRELAALKTRPLPDCPSTRISPPLESAQHYVARAQKVRPEVTRLAQALVAAEADFKATRARYFPDLAFVGRASASIAPGIADQTNPFVIDAANYTALGGAIVARWSLDGVGHYARTAQKAAQREALKAKKKEALQGMRLQVRDAFAQWRAAAKQAEVWEAGQQEMRRWFVGAFQGFEVGAVEAKALTDAVKAYFEARFKQLEATYNANVALAHLEHVVGEALVRESAWDSACEL